MCLTYGLLSGRCISQGIIHTPHNRAFVRIYDKRQYRRKTVKLPL